jgi:hypothetical protein
MPPMTKMFVRALTMFSKSHPNKFSKMHHLAKEIQLRPR